MFHCKKLFFHISSNNVSGISVGNMMNSLSLCVYIFYTTYIYTYIHIQSYTYIYIYDYIYICTYGWNLCIHQSHFFWHTLFWKGLCSSLSCFVGLICFNTICFAPWRKLISPPGIIQQTTNQNHRLLFLPGTIHNINQ